jgi:hypothetical protein
MAKKRGRPNSPKTPRRKATRVMPWHFRERLLVHPITADGRPFVPPDVMERAVDDYRERLSQHGPQPITEHFSSPGEETLQGRVSRIRMVGDEVRISGRLEDTPAGERAQMFDRLVFGYAAVGVPEWDSDVGVFVYSSIRIIVISAMDEREFFGASPCVL